MAKSSFKTWVRESISFKLIAIGTLILILLIPAALIKSLVAERENRQRQVVDEISSKWGNHQVISGPVITIPYRHYYTIVVDKKEQVRYEVRYASFFPSDLLVDGNIEPEIRYRGIYQALLYQSDLEVSCTFAPFDFSEWNISPSHVIWNEAVVNIGITDMRGIKQNIKIQFPDSSIAVKPGVESCSLFESGVNARVPLKIGQKSPVEFSFSIQLNGSEMLSFVPVGEETNVKLHSGWATPKFDGAFLPEHNITDTGFSAHWKVLDDNRNIPLKFLGDKTMNMNEYSFGVNLIFPVDQYKKAERSTKYAILFIVLTFTVFFFIEILSKKKVHPVQYLLAGAGICIFYTLLISISEHLGFNKAYIIASLAITALLTSFSASMFKNLKSTLVMGGFLVLLYSFLYIILQSQDYALLLGSIGLFLVLAIIMFASRKVNWYGKSDEEE